jgi:hypothetical protein
MVFFPFTGFFRKLFSRAAKKNARSAFPGVRIA